LPEPNQPEPYQLNYGADLSADTGGSHAEVDADSEWILRSDLHVQTGESAPASLGVLPSTWKSVCPRSPAAWVRSSGLGIALPYLCDLETAETIGKLQSGALTSSRLDPVSHGRLRAHGLLVRPAAESAVQSRWQRDLETCCSNFVRKQWRRIPPLVESAHRRALIEYYRALRMDGYMKAESPTRQGFHNESVARYFHQELRGTVERIVGEPVKPSYCYVRSYLPGASQPVHTDREQCVWNVSWLIDDLGAAADTEPWPIRIMTDDSQTEVGFGVGEAVLFPGSVPHQRPVLPGNRSVTVIFFHYVPRGFTGSLN